MGINHDDSKKRIADPETIISRTHLAAELHPRRLLPSLTSGLVIGMLQVVLSISFAALIFSGDLSQFVANGIGLLLVSAILSAIIIALTSSLAGMAGGNQDAPAAIIAVLAAAIASSMPEGATDQETFLTVIGAMAFSTLLTGAFLFGLGFFNLGNLSRFLPYPVVGGFLAGTGWLLLTRSFSLMTDIGVSFDQLSQLFQPDILARWLPGLFLAIVFLIASHRSKHYLVMPGLILGAILLFHLIVLISGTSIAEMQSQGLLLGPLPETSLWEIRSISDLSMINWSVIFAQIATIATILIISTIALLLNAGGIELATRRDINLNHELRSAGLSNLVNGLFAGSVTYQQLSLTTLSHHLGVNSRLIGLIAGGLCLLTLLLGSSILALIPKFVLGGLILYLGLSLLIEWVYRTWFILPKIEYAILLLILVVIATIGFLEGVGVGLLVAVILFVINYSRIDTVRYELTGENHQSRVSRPTQHRQLLDHEGEQIYILVLQGFLFFGTADKLLEQIRSRLNNSQLQQPRYFVLDFLRVTGLDSTALLSFSKLKQLAQNQQFVLLFTEPAPEIQLKLEQGGLGDDGELIRHFHDLDKGVEWCEDILLEHMNAAELVAPSTLLDQLAEIAPEGVNLPALIKYFDKQDVAAGQYLMTEGDPPEFMFFIEAGQVSAQLERPGREPLRLETMGSGRIIGELGFYLDQPRTASVVADMPSIVYRLSKEGLRRMENEEPEAASTLHQIIIQLLSARVTHLVKTVNALQR